MTDPTRLARHLVECYRHRLQPTFDGADEKLWVLSLDLLIQRQQLDAASYAAPRLAAALPGVTYFQRMATILERLPPAGGDQAFANFVDDPKVDFQIWPRVGASTVLFAFTGMFGGLGMPLPLLHRWFGQVGAHVVYLRDSPRQAYNEGIRSLAPDYNGTLDALRRIARDLAASRIVCYGNSSGGYGALRYALDLPAEAVLVFGAMTNLSAEFVNSEAFARYRFNPGPDLRPLYLAADRRPYVHILYGADNEIDAMQAGNFAGIPGVTLEAVPEWKGHDVFVQVIAEGRLPTLLRALVAERVSGA
jgi:pimeloyl-ACP methyl ester carboxylesterase